MKIIDPIHAYSLFASEIYNAQSEVLIAVDSLLNLEYLNETELADSLKNISNRVSVMLLYTEDNHDDQLATTPLISSIKNYAQIKCVSGIYGTIFLIDNSKLLTINEDDNGIKTFEIYSNNVSIAKNIGSLLDSLWNEREMLESIIKTSDKLADTNKQLIETNEQLRIHDKMQEEFIKIAAHELRNPIMPILGYAEMLELEQEEQEEEEKEQDVITGEREENKNKNKNETRKDNIQGIIRNADRLYQISSLFLDVARIEAKTFKLAKEQLNLVDVLSNAIDDQIIAISPSKRNKVKLKYTPTKDHILIDADRIRMTQVIFNLLNNAVKFTNEGIISITLEKEKNKAIVRIQDSGIGIDSDIMPNLFSKFATKSDIGGTGLGLYITKSIIEAHGGTIIAGNNQNQDGNRGATFTFSLPLSGQR